MPWRRSRKAQRRHILKWTAFWLLASLVGGGLFWLTFTVADGFEAHHQEQLQKQAQ